MTRRNHLRLVEPLPEPAPFNPETVSVGLDIRDLMPAFEQLLTGLGVTVDYRSERGREMATALLALTASMAGPNIEMPLSVYEEFDKLRSQIGVRSVAEDRTVYRQATAGGAS